MEGYVTGKDLLDGLQYAATSASEDAFTLGNTVALKLFRIPNKRQTGDAKNATQGCVAPRPSANPTLSFTINMDTDVPCISTTAARCSSAHVCQSTKFDAAFDPTKGSICQVLNHPRANLTVAYDGAVLGGLRLDGLYGKFEYVNFVVDNTISNFFQGPFSSTAHALSFESKCKAKLEMYYAPASFTRIMGTVCGGKLLKNGSHAQVLEYHLDIAYEWNSTVGWKPFQNRDGLFTESSSARTWNLQSSPGGFVLAQNVHGLQGYTGEDTTLKPKLGSFVIPYVGGASTSGLLFTIGRCAQERTSGEIAGAFYPTTPAACTTDACTKAAPGESQFDPTPSLLPWPLS
jgi:hypothetical protein